jgi:hypothetical protein
MMMVPCYALVMVSKNTSRFDVSNDSPSRIPEFYVEYPGVIFLKEPNENIRDSLAVLNEL